MSQIVEDQLLMLGLFDDLVELKSLEVNGMLADDFVQDLSSALSVNLELIQNQCCQTFSGTTAKRGKEV